MMDQEIVREAMDKLDALASKVGMTVEKLWPYFVRQQVLEAATVLVATAVFWVAAAVVMGKRVWIKEQIDIDDGREVPIVIGCVVLGLICVVLSIVAISMLPMLFNPEYYAVMDIFRMVR